MEETLVNMIAEVWNLKELGDIINKINESSNKIFERIEISQSGNHAFVYYKQKWLYDENGNLKRIKD